MLQRHRIPRLTPGQGLTGAIVLIALAILVPPLTGWHVYARVGSVPFSETFPPWHGSWDPRTGLGTPFAVLLAVLAVAYAPHVATRLRLGRLLIAAYATSLAWLLALALVDGTAGLSRVLGQTSEYLPTARGITDVTDFLHVYVDRIPIDAEDNWPVHVAGHPPGMVLFFHLLVRVGLGGDLAAGVVVTLIAASIAPAVMLTLHVLGVHDAARRSAPFIVFTPAAVTLAVSADAVMAAVAAWAMVLLALAATRSPWWAVPSGLLFGMLVMMSYGMPVFGVTAVAVLVAARSWRPLLPCAGAALTVVVAFAAAGFAWWEAFPVLVVRYWSGIASARPEAYWLWANIALLLATAGPSVAAGLTRLQDLPRAARTIVYGAVVTVLLADLSLMSKAEVERIWLPMMPWLTIVTASLPEPWRRLGLAVHVITALLVQHLLNTFW